MTGTGGDVPIRAEGVTRILPGPVPVTLVRDVDLSIGQGEFVAITGPSGSGKSSLLYLLGLLDRPTSGKVFVFGENTSDLADEALDRHRLEAIGFVFQFHFLLPEFSALQNVMIPMRKLGAIDGGAQRARGMAILESLDLAEQCNKRPDQLSGGQRQRIAVARALSNDPGIILADEPTGNLDTVNARAVFEIFRDLTKLENKTAVVVTHDPALAAMTDRQIRIVDGMITDDGLGGGSKVLEPGVTD